METIVQSPGVQAYMARADAGADGATARRMETALAYQMPSWTYARIANPTQSYL